MFIWVAINVDDKMPSVIKTIKNVDKILDFKNYSVSLPLHVSLKISFNVEQNIFDNVVDEVLRFYSSIHPFNLEIDCLELNGNIVWIRYKNSDYLSRIKAELDKMLLDKFGVVLHECDSKFIFHSTLFLGDSPKQSQKWYDSIKQMELPKQIVADKFLIGNSAIGKAGTYSVLKEIAIG